MLGEFGLGVGVVVFFIYGLVCVVEFWREGDIESSRFDV